MHIKVSEAQAKRALYDSLGISQDIVSITSKEQLNALHQTEPWLTKIPLVAKPDMYIGKRGQNNLISLGKSWQETNQWLANHFGKTIQINGKSMVLDRFLVEPYITHTLEQEYFLALQTEHDHDVLLLGNQGGVNVEDDWNNIGSLAIDLINGLDKKTSLEFIRSIIRNEEKSNKLNSIIIKLYDFFVQWGFVSLEINPLIITEDGVYIADLKCRIDSDAHWHTGEKWRTYFDLEPNTNKTLSDEIEQKIRQLDATSSSSLKLRVLNPNGSIWPLVAGGGASIIVADALTQKGLYSEIGFYGEYSGNPDHQLMHEYTEGVIRLLLQAQTTKPKYLLILGAVANFTDVAETFAGISSVLHKYAEPLKEQRVTVIVRRGGPNYQTGLALIKEQLQQLQLPHTVHGPETGITDIIWNI